MECCVCYSNYDSNKFQIGCNHLLCYCCYKQIKNKVCPICRTNICVTKLIRKYKRIPKGKIPLYKFSKLKTFLKYRYLLPDATQYSKRQKFAILKVLYLE